MTRSNIANFVVSIVYQGRAYKFNSVVSFDQANPREWNRKIAMQAASADSVDWQTGNQEPCTADFTISPVSQEEFDLLKKIYAENGEFDLSGVVKLTGESYIWTKPRIRKQPMPLRIDETDASFEVMVNILCNEIVHSY